MASNLKKLYLITGKGGVGKTSLAFSYSNYLKSKGIKASYCSNYTNTYGQQTSVESKNQVQDLVEKSIIENFELNLLDALEAYIYKKLNSKIAAKSIIKLPFFKSLIEVVPGLNSIISYGHIIDTLEESEDLILVIDSPASGHFLQDLGALYKFSEIFKSGPLHEDCKKTINFLEDKEKTKAIIVSKPTNFSLNESIELKEEISLFSNINTQIIFNKVLDNNVEYKSEHLKKMLESQSEILKEYSNLETSPWIIEKNTSDFIKVLSQKNDDQGLK